MLISAALAALATTTASASAANSFASATLGPITMTLYDLNPLDGIQSSLTFAANPPGVGTTAYSSISQSTTGLNQSLSNTSTTPWGDISASKSASLVSAHASVSGAAQPSAINGVTLSASGSATNTVSNSVNFSSYTAWVNAPNSKGEFTLSANTLVVFTADYTTSASLNGAPSDYYYNWAYASAGLSVSGTGAAGIGDQSSSALRDASVHALFQPWISSESGTMTVSFLNMTGGTLNGLLAASVHVSGEAYSVAAIPEPESYAMMLAGLGFMGMIARRRKIKAASV